MLGTYGKPVFPFLFSRPAFEIADRPLERRSAKAGDIRFSPRCYLFRVSSWVEGGGRGRAVSRGRPRPDRTARKLDSSNAEGSPGARQRGDFNEWKIIFSLHFSSLGAEVKKGRKRNPVLACRDRSWRRDPSRSGLRAALVARGCLSLIALRVPHLRRAAVGRLFHPPVALLPAKPICVKPKRLFAASNRRPFGNSQTFDN